MTSAVMENEIKLLIIESLFLEDIKPEDIKNDEALFGDGLGLDSIDALELGIALQRKYGIIIKEGDEENRQHFASVNSLIEFVKNEILYKVEDVIVDLLAIDRALIKPETKLFEDLDFDSIDAIELILQLEEKYDEKISADKLKSARTIQDVVDCLYELLRAREEEVIAK